MPSRLIPIITSGDPAIRDRSLDAICADATVAELSEECGALEAFRRSSKNLYQRVRALFFLYAIYRFHLPSKSALPVFGAIPFDGHEHLLRRRFGEAISTFLKAQEAQGPNDPLSSALAMAYHGLAFQTLADQVRKSVRSVRGNQWMFRVGHPMDHPLRIRPELFERPSSDSLFPLLHEATPVRMDLSHSAWSDIFFLGMDFPEGAQVLNVSIDLAVLGRDGAPAPPVQTYLRVIDEPLLRLTCVDLGATADITELTDVFDFAKDYLGLLKAAVIAAGLVPPGMEGSAHAISELLARLVGPGMGLEIASNVNNIPKGSRLAVSTNLLGSLIALCMRATGQARTLTGPLLESERRLVAARAILGEWLGGSGGGWQDSGGIWPGIKLIKGVLAREGDLEFGISRGALLPVHEILGENEAPRESRQKLRESLILVHGGMAQNVGPILQMVTEKYLLRSEAEWRERKEAILLLQRILDALKAGDIRALGQETTRNFFGPLQTIIPWASNFYTEKLITRIKAEFQDDFLGFWMLGGMSGGGMGFMVTPARKKEAQARLLEVMTQLKRELEHALPFAMEPVVYDFAINERGTVAELFTGAEALMPAGYYALTVPSLLRTDSKHLPAVKRIELDRFGAACRLKPELRGMVQLLFDRLLPQSKEGKEGQQNLTALLDENGFDRDQHELVRTELQSGRIGLAQNRLPPNTTIKDIQPDDVVNAVSPLADAYRDKGLELLADGQAAVVTLAAGIGSRWTQGAGVVKALHPFCKFSGRHRTFIEAHLAKNRRIGRMAGESIPHIFPTSYLTHGPIKAVLERENNYGYRGPVLLSPGRAIGLRLVPMIRDLRFAWEEMPQQLLDEQAQKVRRSLRAALTEWARKTGQGTDYTDNAPLQCLHPIGHWFEIPNLLRNGTLLRLLEDRPRLRYLMLHNIDTLGANLDPALLGWHADSGAGLSFEVITRRIDDRGGGLARVDGRLRLLEGLAMPHDRDEFALSYYNSMTTWIDLHHLLDLLKLSIPDLSDGSKVTAAIRTLSLRMPTYVTLKDVKKRWGHGQEDTFPVAQFEKLWGDMTTLPEANVRFLHVPRVRGQQLKDQAQLDGWLRDGSAAYLESIAEWGD